MPYRKVLILRDIRRDSFLTGEPMDWRSGAIETGGWDPVSGILTVNWGCGQVVDLYPADMMEDGVAEFQILPPGSCPSCSWEDQDFVWLCETCYAHRRDPS